MDKLTAIRSFVEVASCGSFTLAAERLNLSRLQVSRHVREIEDWLGQRLLHRTTRKVSLTDNGQHALQHCRRIIEETQQMTSLAQQQRTELRGSIRVASPIGLAQNLLFELVDAFLATHPQTRIHLLVSDSYAHLVDERVDIALRFSHQPDEQWIARSIFNIDTVLCASPIYVQQAGMPVTPQDLPHHNCLVHLEQHSWQFGEELVDVKGNLQANDLGVLLKAALRHRGIVRLPCDLANTYLENGQLLALLSHFPGPSLALWAVYLSRLHQSPLVRAFIDFLVAHWRTDIKAAALPPDIGTAKE
ncbi:LysR family transcriptional regulator [Bowmanella denitrificans]|uniref:LysR family transcriptional regulator n=1 Tax=Bowmanella denitrificans TaxID=366582 RepID=A0ABP3GIB6_9ALTE